MVHIAERLAVPSECSVQRWRCLDVGRMRFDLATDLHSVRLSISAKTSPMMLVVV